MPVRVQGHSGRVVPEEPLDGENIRACGDGQRGAGMTQFMRNEVGFANVSGRWVELLRVFEVRQEPAAAQGRGRGGSFTVST